MKGCNFRPVSAPNEIIQVGKRTWEICELIRLGHTDAEIGAALGISPRTVSNSLSRVYDRTVVSSRAHIAYLVTAGLIKQASGLDDDPPHRTSPPLPGIK